MTTNPIPNLAKTKTGLPHQITVFDMLFMNHILPSQIDTFRKDLCKCLEHDALFNNHLSHEEEAKRKTENNRNGQHPQIFFQYEQPKRPAKSVVRMVGINIGAQRLERAYEQGELAKFNWPPKSRYGLAPTMVNKQSPFEIRMEQDPKAFRYLITDWAALNKKTTDDYHTCGNMIERVEVLQRKLRTHIGHFLSAVGCFFDYEEIQVEIREIYSIKQARFDKGDNEHKRSLPCSIFRLSFFCNMALPAHICLGSNKAYGFGRIKQLHK